MIRDGVEMNAEVFTKLFGAPLIFIKLEDHKDLRRIIQISGLIHLSNYGKSFSEYISAFLMHNASLELKERLETYLYSFCRFICPPFLLKPAFNGDKYSSAFSSISKDNYYMVLGISKSDYLTLAPAGVASLREVDNIFIFSEDPLIINLDQFDELISKITNE